MKTLYDILGVHPDDDSERLKAAFRKAVKACHPDLNVGDPDAPERFMQIVRAKAILSDPEARAAYDRMLEFKRQHLRPKSKPTAMHSIVADAIAAAFLAVVVAGTYTLFTYISDKTVAKTKPLVVVAHQPAEDVAARSMPAVAAASGESQRDKFEGAETSVANAVAPAAIGKVVEPLPSIGLAANRLSAHLHEQGIASYHKGDISSAITNFDLAIRLDPDFESAYVDRSIALYRIHEFSRAFADIGQAIRIENSRRTATPSAR